MAIYIFEELKKGEIPFQIQSQSKLMTFFNTLKVLKNLVEWLKVNPEMRDHSETLYDWVFAVLRNREKSAFTNQNHDDYQDEMKRLKYYQKFLQKWDYTGMFTGIQGSNRYRG